MPATATITTTSADAIGAYATHRASLTALRDEIQATVDRRGEPTVGELAARDDRPAAAHGELERRRGATRAVADDLLALAQSGPSDDPRRPGDVAAAWLMEFTSANTRQAYATDLAAFFVWCARRPVDVWEVRRYHLAEYLAQPKPDGRPFAPKTLEKRASPASSLGCTPSRFPAASAGAELEPRCRSFASSVLDTVIATVPAAPANRPLPTAAAVSPSVTSNLLERAIHRAMLPTARAQQTRSRPVSPDRKELEER